MFDVDWFGLLCRDVLRERLPELVAEACAWSVGLSDRAHVERRRGRLVPTGTTNGERAARGLALAGEEEERLDLGGARPGSFRDALGAVDPDGAAYADRFDREVVEPFARACCVRAAERARGERRGEWAELLADLGEDDDADPAEVVRAGEWEVPLRAEAELLVLAALGDLPLLAVEAEGLPLSLVRSAEAVAAGAVGPPGSVGAPAPPAGEPAAEPGPEGGPRAAVDPGAAFLAREALRAAGLPVPVPPRDADRLLVALLGEGLEAEEIDGVLPDLPLAAGTAETVAGLLRAGR